MWPGNIRELKNVLTYALYSMTDDTLHVEDLPARFMNNLRARSEEKTKIVLPGAEKVTVPEAIPAPVAGKGHKLSDISADAEKEAISQALLKYRFNKSLVARTLGISRNKLYKKLREYGLLDTDPAKD